MAWTTPATFTTGNVLTAAQMNTNVRDNTGFLHSPPGCLAQRTTNQSIGAGSLTGVGFNATDIYDTDTMHDPVGSSSLITFNTAGVYLVSATVQFAPSATGLRRMALYQGAGSEFASAYDGAPSAAVNSSLVASFQNLFAAGSNVQCGVLQSSGGTLNITTSGLTSFTGQAPVIQFGAQWISDGT